MMTPTSKCRNFCGGFKVFRVLCAVAALFSEGGFAQETQQEMRGIEKKDIRRGQGICVAIAYTADSDAAAARALAQELKVVADAIASGAQLTEADAARTEQSSTLWPHMHKTATHRFQNWLETMLNQRPGGRKTVLVLSCTRTSAARSGEPSGGGPCPSSCEVLGEWCVCLLDHVPVKSTFTDVEPIVIVVNSRSIEPAQVEQLAAELKVTLPTGTPIVREIKKSPKGPEL